MKFLNVSGIGPEREFLAKLRLIRFLKFPKLGGICPVKWLPLSMRDLNKGNWPKLEGMLPSMELSSRMSWVSRVRFEKLWGIVPAILFIPLITKVSKKCKLPKEGDKMPFMYMALSLSEGPCNTNPVTLPVAGLHWTPSHPSQQFLPVHEERMNVVSLKILALKPRRATLSASEHAAGACTFWARVCEYRSQNERMSKNLKTHFKLCILGNGFGSELGNLQKK